MHDDLSRPEFSVHAFLKDGRNWPVVRFVDAASAMHAAKRATEATLGPVTKATRIIVTNGADETILEWKRGEGVTWPTS